MSVVETQEYEEKLMFVPSFDFANDDTRNICMWLSDQHRLCKKLLKHHANWDLPRFADELRKVIDKKFTQKVIREVQGINHFDTDLESMVNIAMSRVYHGELVQALLEFHGLWEAYADKWKVRYTTEGDISL